MRKGPRGATVQRQIEITQTSTWKFTATELRERLSLPPDATLAVYIPGGADWSNADLVLDDGDQLLIARVTETRSKGGTDGE